MALRRDDDREKRTAGRGRTGQRASRQAGLFDLREEENTGRQKNGSSPAGGSGRPYYGQSGSDEQPYRERHRVEVDGRKTTGSGQGSSADAYAAYGNTPETGIGSAKKEISTDLLISNRQPGGYGRRASQTGAGYGSQSRQYGTGYGEQSRQYGTSYGNQSRQTGSGYGSPSRQYGTEYGNQSRQTGTGYGNQSRKYGTEYGNQSRQTGNDYGSQRHQTGSGYRGQSRQTGTGYGGQRYQTGSGYGGQSRQYETGYGEQSGQYRSGYGSQQRQTGTGYGNQSRQTGTGYYRQDGQVKPRDYYGEADGRDYGRTDRSDYGRSEVDRSGFGRSNYGRSDYSRSDYSRSNSNRTDFDRAEYGRYDSNRSDSEQSDFDRSNSDRSDQRRIKREQSRKERARQIRKFYLMGGTGLLLILVLAVFTIVSLIRVGSSRKKDSTAPETEAAAEAETQKEEAKGSEETDGEASAQKEAGSAQKQDTGAAGDAQSDNKEAGQGGEGSSEKTASGPAADGQTAQENLSGGQKQEAGTEEAEGEQPLGQTPGETPSLPAGYAGLDDWRLILVNPWNRIPDGFTVETTVLPNGEAVDSRCYAELMSMLSDCEAAGGAPIVCSSFRTHEKQIGLFEAQVNMLTGQGMAPGEAQKEAGTVVAAPGTSEHELGLAVDICDTNNQLLDESQEDTFTQQWLMEHCWDYGFILRYPNDKSAVTGIIYEPWHYRYVGTGASNAIRQSGLCFEEYLASLKQALE